MPVNGPDTTGDRPLLLQGSRVGLALMRREDIPAIARWNQDTASSFAAFTTSR